MSTGTAPINEVTPLSAPVQLTDAITRMRAPVIVSHVVPDADALGSMFGMAAGIQSGTCHPKVSLPEGSLSQRLRFLSEKVSIATATPEDFRGADGFIVLDTAKKPRCNVGPALRDTDWSGGRPLVNIDHHSTNTVFGDVNWIVDEASSSCELVYRVLRAMDRAITPAVASLLYAGIQTDTLGFSLPTTTAAALRVAGDLVELGADVGDLGERLSRSQSASEFALMRVIYDNTRVLSGGRLAYSSATFEEITASGCTAADIDDQISVPRSLDGVVLAMLFTEGKRSKTRINFRSSGTLTISALAAEFGGGGHAQASGAILDCGIEEAVARVIPRAEAHLKKFS